MYREWAPPAALRSSLACVWVRDTDPRGETVRVLPDACMDLMWVDDELQIAGPDTTANLAPRPPGGRIVGARFRPGAAAPILGVDASEHTDGRADLADVWGSAARRLSEQLADARSVTTAAGLLCAAVSDRAASSAPADPVVEAMVHATQQRHGAPVRAFASELGISERQLRRRAHVALGYGPKTLDRILRFQRFLRLAGSTGPGRLAITAAAAGYADQAHLTRECRRLTGLSPTALLVGGDT
jgi:AraC-like DNA-binding protein